jgi:PIN domain nuclease of toxin-antitoxin system
MATARYSILETTVRQAIRGGQLPLHHKDPFDRLLAAQALDLRIPLVSRDSIFDLYGVNRIWA